MLTTNNSSFRDYPTYDKTSLYLKTKTKVVDKTFVNFTGYYDSYYNIMKQFDDNQYLLQNKNSSFSSVYDDYTLGGILTASTEIIKDNALTLTINEKYDHHKEYNAEISANATVGQKLKVGEPEQSYKDNTLFIGLEDVFTLNQFKFIAGGSFSYRNNILAQDYGKTATSGKNSILYDFPKSEENVFDYKFGVIFTPADGHNLTFSASKRSRFASQKERYSFRYGRFIPNPDLKSEFTYAFDLTYSRKISDYLQYEVSGFFNSIRNAILDRTIDDINNISQNVNIGKVVSRGFEASFGYSPIRYIILGGNYSFIEMMDKTEANEHFTNVPRHKIVGYGTFEIPQIKITINTNIEYYGKRYRTSQGEQTPDFTLVNAKLSYKITRMLNFDFGVKNLLDKDYYWSYGYPMYNRQNEMSKISKRNVQKKEKRPS